MAISTTKRAIGYYLIAIAVVFGLMALSFLPAQAEDVNVKKDSFGLKAPKVTFPTYPENDPSLIKDASDQVKIGDKIQIKYTNLPAGRLDYVRISEPRLKNDEGEYLPPQYEVFSKDFRDGQPSKETEVFEYTLPCWTEPSKDAEDQRDLKINLFYKDQSTGTSFVSLTALKSSDLCKKTDGKPKPQPNYNADMLDGKDPGSSDSSETPKDPSPTTPLVPPVVKISPDSVAQKGAMSIDISKLPTDPTTKVTVNLVAKDEPEVGNIKAMITTLQPTKGKTTLPLTWTVPCKIAAGNYGLTVDVLTDGGGMPSADSKHFKITKGNCGTTPTPPSDKPSEPSPNPTGTSGKTDSSDTSGDTDSSDTSGDTDSSDTGSDSSEKPDTPPAGEVSLTIHDATGKQIQQIPRNTKITLKTSYTGDANQVEFTLNSTPFSIGSVVLKDHKGQIDTVVPCDIPVGKHTLEAAFSGKEPLKGELSVDVTQGNCGTQGKQVSTGLTPLSPGTTVATGPALAQTGTPSAILALLALMFAGTGIYLIIARKQHI